MLMRDRVVGVTDDRQHSYLDFASVGRGRWYWYLLGTFLILFMWSVLGGIVSEVPTILEAVGTVESVPTWMTLTFMLLGFVGLFFGVPLVVRVINGRPWRTVITPFTRFNWGLVGKGMLFWLIPLAVFQTIASVVDSDGLRFTADLNGWLLSLVAVLAFLFIQTTGEELFFRGYLMQWTALATRRTWILALVSGLLFGAPHWLNPEVTSEFGLAAIVVATTYVVTGFVWAWISVRSGTIELAVGAHFINNFVAFLVISPDNAVLDSAMVLDGSADAYLNSAVSVLTALAFLVLCWGQRGSGEPIAALVAEPVPAQVAAGWYADPLDESQVRWWDGSAWTEHLQNKPEA